MDRNIQHSLLYILTCGDHMANFDPWTNSKADSWIPDAYLEISHQCQKRQHSNLTAHLIPIQMVYAL